MVPVVITQTAGKGEVEYFEPFLNRNIVYYLNLDYSTDMTRCTRKTSAPFMGWSVNGHSGDYLYTAPR